MRDRDYNGLFQRKPVGSPGSQVTWTSAKVAETSMREGCVRRMCVWEELQISLESTCLSDA